MKTATTILIPLEGEVRTTPSGHRKLVDFYTRCKSYYNCTIEVDLSELYWFDANLCAVLQAIFYKLRKDNGLLFSVDVESIKDRLSILFRNGFLSSLLPLTDIIGSTVKIQQFEVAEDVKFYNYINNDLLNHPMMVHHHCENMLDHFFEVFANIQTHAATNDPIFACGQYYHSKKEVYFTIVDLGVGFLPPITAYTGGSVTTADEAINWAVQYNHSTKSKEETGGLGLFNLFEYCKETGGEFNVATGDAYWGSNLGELGTRRIPEFVGTTVHFIYNCG